MGIDYTADLGYGIKITDAELLEKLCEEEIDLPKELVIFWGGYDDDNETYVAVKESHFDEWKCMDDKIINPDKLIVKPEWDGLIKKFMKEHKIKNAKIGWRLVSGAC